MLIPTWNAEVDGPGVKDPQTAFTKDYVIGKRPIVFKGKVMKGLPAGWKVPCDALPKLSRRQLCALYLYTTQMYEIVSTFLRSGRLDASRFKVNDLAAWPTYVSVFSDGMLPSEFITKYADKRAVSTRAALEAKAALRANRSSVTDWDAYGRESTKVDRAIASAVKKESSFFSKAFHARMRENVVEASDGFMFYDQAVRVLGLKKRLSLTQWRAVLPGIDAKAWRRIMEQFVRDIDSVFEAMPGAPKATLYRGTRGAVPSANASYTSATLKRSVARDFIDPEADCCVITIKVPAGGKVVPLFGLSRYPVELEVLLPRGRKV